MFVVDVQRWLRPWLRSLTDLFYPPLCSLCGDRIGGAGDPLCVRCRRQLPWIREPFCEVCSQPFDGAIESRFVCPNCQDRRFHFVCTVSPLRARAGVRELIHRLKYSRQTELAPMIAGWMAAGMEDHRFNNADIDALVPVPLHPLRLREREFNQAALLAAELGRRTGLKVLDALERVRYTETQTHFDRAARMQNLRNAFRSRKNTPIDDMNLLLIDDVFTTGSTLDACSDVLLRAGAASVHALTAARA